MSTPGGSGNPKRHEHRCGPRPTGSNGCGLSWLLLPAWLPSPLLGALELRRPRMLAGVALADELPSHRAACDRAHLSGFLSIAAGERKVIPLTAQTCRPRSDQADLGVGALYVPRGTAKQRADVDDWDPGVAQPGASRTTEVPSWLASDARSRQPIN